MIYKKYLTCKFDGIYRKNLKIMVNKSIDGRLQLRSFYRRNLEIVDLEEKIGRKIFPITDATDWVKSHEMREQTKWKGIKKRRNCNFISITTFDTFDYTEILYFESSKFFCGADGT